MAHIDPKNWGPLSSGLIPANLNQTAITAFGTHMKGGHDYPYLAAPASDPAKWDDVNDEPILQSGQPVDEDYLPPYRTAPGLLDIHPNRMLENMKVSVKIGFEVLTCQLTRNPDFLQWRQITEVNWNAYWEITNRMIPDNAQIIEFAEEYDGTFGGYPDPGRPPYDDDLGEYPAGAEGLWETVEDVKRHRWYRIKYLSYDENDDPVVGDISPPIPRGEFSTTFVKEVNYYMRNGEIGVDDLEDSRPATPPTFVDGAPNNAPVGWDDSVTPTPTTDYLWVTRAIKELNGNIVTDLGWTLPAYVEENIETIRFSATGVPDPETIVSNTEDVATGSNDADLIAAGWVNTIDYNVDIHFYTATRTGTSGSWTTWKIERTRLEDGTRERIVFKLLPITSDYDDLTWQTNNTPVGIDPSDKGWLEYVQTEGLFLANFRSTAITYADGSFKQDWTAPKPFTGLDVYNDYISIHPDDTGIDPTKFLDDTIIKSFVGGVETHDPEDLWLRSQLYKGQTDIIADDATKIVTYQWNKIFDDGEFITPVDLGTTRDIEVNHADVTGRAIFQVVMTMDDAPTYTEIADAIAGGAISGLPVFTEEISIKDQVDGLDGRTVSASATESRFLLDTTPDPDEFLPASIIIRTEVDNVEKSTLKWYYLDGADPIVDTWIEITATTSSGASSPKYTYKNTNNDLVLIGGDITTATDIFTLVGINDIYFKCVAPAVGALSSLEDWVMVSKVDAGVLTSGEAAFDVQLDNVYHQIRVDELGDFITGQLAAILTNIEVRKGVTVQAHAAYSTAVVSVSGVLTDTGDILLGNDGGNKHTVQVDEPTIAWDNGEKEGTIVLDVTLGAETKRVVIGLGTTLEPTGFTGLNIVSDRGTFTFDYSTGGRDDIILDAELTKQVAGSGNEPVAGYNYEWKVLDGTYKTFTVGQVITGETTSILTVATDDIDQSVQLQCAAYLTKTGPDYDPPFYTDTVRMNDVPDAQTRLLFNDNIYTNIPPQAIAEYSTYPDNDAGVDTWYKASHVDAVWYCKSVDGGITWTQPYLISGTPGTPGVDGDDGLAGTDGAAWLQGSSDPTGGVGSVGDWYMNTTSFDIFEKTGASTWTSRGNLKGETGDDGTDGHTVQVQVGGSVWGQANPPEDGDIWIDKV